MSQSNTLTVQILDKEYCINCPDDERANLESAARYLDGKMREIRSSGKVIGADRVAGWPPSTSPTTCCTARSAWTRKAARPASACANCSIASTAPWRIRPMPAKPDPGAANSGILASAPWCVGQSVMSLSR